MSASLLVSAGRDGACVNHGVAQNFMGGGAALFTESRKCSKLRKTLGLRCHEGCEPHHTAQNLNHCEFALAT